MGLTKEEKMRAEMRVKIAKDAIAQVLSGKIRPIHGYFVKPKRKGACETCAAGALLVAHAGLQGRWFSSIESLTSELYPFFSYDHLREIEKAFEDDWGRNSWQERDVSSLPKVPKTVWAKILKINDGFLFDELKQHAYVLALMILHNIVRNNGTFVPEDKRPVTVRGPWEGTT